MDFMDNLAKNYRDVFYFIFRLLVGLLFFTHGVMKFMGGMPETLMLIAGIIEIIVGVMLVLGVYVRWASFFGAGMMLVAYFMVHAPQGWSPLANGGELALMYFAAFCTSFILGNGKWAVMKGK